MYPTGGKSDKYATKKRTMKKQINVHHQILCMPYTMTHSIVVEIDDSILNGWYQTFPQ